MLICATTLTLKQNTHSMLNQGVPPCQEPGSGLHLRKRDEADVLDDAVAEVVGERLTHLDAERNCEVVDAGRLDCASSRPHNAFTLCGCAL